MEVHEIKKILVPIDFSALSGNALQTAIAICKRQLAILTLIHVIEVPFPHWPQKLKEAMENLGKLARELRINHDLVINHIVQVGNPAYEICRWALQKEFDLIVMGINGHSGQYQFSDGSTACKVVYNSPCPVMTIPGNHQWFDFRKILFPIRLVPHALDKYDYIRTILFKNNSSLLVTGLVNKSESYTLAEMKNLVETIQYKIEADTVPYKILMQRCDNVAREVLKISQSEQPDLIVITVTLDTPIKEFFQGPFTRDIVNQAKFPVLSIRPFASVEPLNGFYATQQPIAIL